MTRANAGQESLSHKPSQFSTGVTPLNPGNAQDSQSFQGVRGTMTGATETKTFPE